MQKYSKRRLETRIASYRKFCIFPTYYFSITSQYMLHIVRDQCHSFIQGLGINPWFHLLYFANNFQRVQNENTWIPSGYWPIPVQRVSSRNFSNCMTFEVHYKSQLANPATLLQYPAVQFPTCTTTPLVVHVGKIQERRLGGINLTTSSINNKSLRQPQPVE